MTELFGLHSGAAASHKRSQRRIVPSTFPWRMVSEYHEELGASAQRISPETSLVLRVY